MSPIVVGKMMEAVLALCIAVDSDNKMENPGAAPNLEQPLPDFLTPASWTHSHLTLLRLPYSEEGK